MHQLEAYVACVCGWAHVHATKARAHKSESKLETTLHFLRLRQTHFILWPEGIITRSVSQSKPVATDWLFERFRLWEFELSDATPKMNRGAERRQ